MRPGEPGSRRPCPGQEGTSNKSMADLGEWSLWCQGLGRVTYKHRDDRPRTRGGKKHLSSRVLNARGQGMDECRCLSWERQPRDKSKRQWVSSPCHRVPSPCHKATPPSCLVTRIQFTGCVDCGENVSWWRKCLMQSNFALLGCTVPCVGSGRLPRGSRVCVRTRCFSDVFL